MVINYFLKAYEKALKLGYIKPRALLVAVNFTKPSSEKRLQVIQSPGTTEEKVMFETYVTHGSGSGGLYAEKFSNINNSHQSSLGVFRTAETYIGKHGLSCKLDGLEPLFNDQARNRSIVIHGAGYIGNGETGRSWGCFAVPIKETTEFVNLVKNGSLLIAYYPDKTWLSRSIFLQ